MSNESNCPSVSVIVPIYNVEKYLRSCLESLSNQTLSSLEVIMVNDGATDSSPQIIQEFEERYPNFSVINRENGGLSAARNTGIQHARGEYIGFVDGDDFVDYRMYEMLFNTAVNSAADIVKSGVLLFQNQTGEILDLRNIPVKQRIYETPEEALTAFLEKKMNIVVVNALYKRDLFNDLKFPEGVKFEDHYFTPNALICCNRFVQINDIHYYYRKRRGSITHQIDTKGKVDKVQSVNELYRVIHQMGNPDVYAGLYSGYFMNMASNYHNSLIYKDPFSLLKKHYALPDVINPEVIRFVIESGSLSRQEKRMLNAMRQSHSLYFILQKVLRLTELLKKDARTDKQNENTGSETDADKLKLYRLHIEKYA